MSIYKIAPHNIFLKCFRYLYPHNIELLENSLTLESCGHFVLKSKKEKSGSKILWNLFYLEKKPLRNCWNMFWLHGVLDLVESDSAVSMIPRRDLNMGISPRNLNHIWKHFSTWVGRTDGLESREKKQGSKKSWCPCNIDCFITTGFEWRLKTTVRLSVTAR